ncbi:MAG: sulfatase-like hydrolase/transferase [Opitutaceae bacterium]|jgi:hypothetical protein|nr:sulfatase-like hydrolase/transferase [Opitutaceae bacterium]
MTPPRPNVLMMLAGQHNARLLGCAGHPQARTPHLDTFARQGVRFTRAYAQNPISTPSRVSILSGQYCYNHGYYSLGGPRPASSPAVRTRRRTGGLSLISAPNTAHPMKPALALLSLVPLSAALAAPARPPNFINNRNTNKH